MNIDEMLKRLEQKYTEIKDMEFDSTTNYCTPQGYGYIKGFGYAIELIKSYQESNEEREPQ